MGAGALASVSGTADKSPSFKAMWAKGQSR
jgi:hypothetical protein